MADGQVDQKLFDARRLRGHICRRRRLALVTHRRRFRPLCARVLGRGRGRRRRGVVLGLTSKVAQQWRSVKVNGGIAKVGRAGRASAGSHGRAVPRPRRRVD
jgi:hypothetical protein